MSKSEKLQILRHSAAHLLAQALVELFPDTILTIGPATSDGFFYDVLPKTNFKEEDLPRIAQRMTELAHKDLPITHEEISKERARIMFANNPFKQELIDQIPGETVGLSRQGGFFDLCRGGHVPSTKDIQHFKLLSLSGSYWRADKNKQALQRITGTAFLTEHDMQEHERQKEEAALYDHRRLGKQMDLFSFHEEGVGFPFFHAKGKLILNLLTSYLRTLLAREDYHEIQTPLMLSDELWKQSGHYAHYKKNMYFCCIDEKNYAIRPMNCPGSILVYKERPRSYRELPLKLAEFGLVHRHELSGVLHGLFRVRAFTIDDAHIYCTVDQMQQEIVTLINLIYKVLSRFNFEHIKVAISTKPENAMGDANDEILWEKATQALKDSLDNVKIPYAIQEGEGAFYGPKIEFVIRDSMQREWQCSTIQVDFFQPRTFDLSYISSAGTKEYPVVIHRAIFGSLERFFGILLEHYKGVLPFWLAPLQVRLLPITDEQIPYAQAILAHLIRSGARAEIDLSFDPLSGKIKSAQLEKIPWMLVLGKKEAAEKTVTLRHQNGSQESGLTMEQILHKIEQLTNVVE